jgi:hypothetical protein
VLGSVHQGHASHATGHARAMGSYPKLVSGQERPRVRQGQGSCNRCKRFRNGRSQAAGAAQASWEFPKSG